MAVERILVVGNGGRENALAWALARSPQQPQVWISPGNGASASIPGCTVLNHAASDAAALAECCQTLGISLAVIGPEAPLAAGLADQLRSAGIAVFGPGADGAQLEASKEWAKTLMQQAGVPTAGFWVATSAEQGQAIAREQGQALVVKADGLAAGKGVTVASSVEETLAAIADCFSGRFGDAGQRVVLEEASKALRSRCLPCVMASGWCCYRRRRITNASVKATGPNTGGMGAYAPAPLLDEAGLQQVRKSSWSRWCRPCANGESTTAGDLCGADAHQQRPQVIEFNCRFGDPECQTLMPLLQGDLAEVLLACATGQLDQAPALSIAPLCSACVVAAAAGYPGTPQLGDPISDEGPGLGSSGEASQLFCAGVKADANGGLQTSGGRVLAAVAQGHDFDEAFAKAYGRLAKVNFSGMQLRRDIGHQVRRL